MERDDRVACVDLFCGAGGLTHGFGIEGLRVAAGVDLDSACRYPYEANNEAVFVEKDVAEFTASELTALFGNARVKILAGCAPCQPFSTYAQRYDELRDHKWSLLYEFARLAKATKPDVITMENVPKLAKHPVFLDFVDTLQRLNYRTWFKVVDSCDYGVPQSRKRLVLLASLHGDIELVPPTTPKPRTVKQAIGRLRPLAAGEGAPRDPLHVTATLSDLNMKRMKASKPGGTWRDWPQHLVADCHKRSSGKTFPGVYGRMEWDKPSPTMTTQCFGFGNGRFGHPDQDRAISLREAAILQSFPKSYKFVESRKKVQFKALGRLIGNAVPVELARAVAVSIKLHVKEVGISRG
ncbi:DNA cytosine methyltransferase [Congregibacter litoralis]|uniref:Cytosine-specific methyltransferase n=1 Tax=Congregibacter litoralis KT71 TaxID=314285 RepID=A4AB17_9GAMM|nr:DNA cytosine methyltransferase [Congregibacter litoralis]EAQ96889.2 DNA-methyltransferase (dcm) [Congregibacter litoralis KT71]